MTFPIPGSFRVWACYFIGRNVLNFQTEILIVLLIFHYNYNCAHKITFLNENREYYQWRRQGEHRERSPPPEIEKLL